VSSSICDRPPQTSQNMSAARNEAIWFGKTVRGGRIVKLFVCAIAPVNTIPKTDDCRSPCIPQQLRQQFLAPRLLWPIPVQVQTDRFWQVLWQFCQGLCDRELGHQKSTQSLKIRLRNSHYRSRGLRQTATSAIVNN